MDELTQVFFFITAIGVIVLTVAVVIITVYVVKVLHDVRSITNRLANDTVSAFVASVATESAIKLVGKFFNDNKKTATKTRRTK